jgi:long-chain acyl-CoA synthetase
VTIDTDEKEAWMFSYEKPDNLVALFENAVSNYSGNDLFGTKQPDGTYIWVTYGEVGRRVDHLRAGLKGLGVSRGDAVGIIANNRTEWAVAAFASFGIGARFVPMYENELPKIWRYVINDAAVKVVLVAGPVIAERLNADRRGMPGLEAVYVIDTDDSDPLAMAALERRGRLDPIPAYKPKPEEIATLIYTSGTTGDPKGVLLSHGNFTSNARAGYRLFKDQLDADSCSFSILPWAHSFGQTAELYNWLQFGGRIGFMGAIDTLAEDLKAVAPTLLIAVPRVFNKIHDGILSKINATGGLARKLFAMGVESARQIRASGPDKVALGTRLKFRLADAVVFNKIRARFGGRLKGALSGSATMNVQVGHFFRDLGIPVYDCYGLTETTPAVTMNSPKAFRPGSVGRPIEHVTVMIDKKAVEPGAPDGEIVVYGPNVMQGYHNKPEATAATMTADGGFRTGDRGYLDKDGFLFISGRIKEQYKLENGKYVFPAVLEEEIRLLPWVENAMLVGEGRAYNICLIVLDLEVVGQWARERGAPDHPKALTAHRALQEMVGDAIRSHLKGKFGAYEIPKKFIFLSEGFSLENGMLTQTMKLKRREVLARYRPQIDTLFGSRDQYQAATG